MHKGTRQDKKGLKLSSKSPQRGFDYDSSSYSALEKPARLYPAALTWFCLRFTRWIVVQNPLSVWHSCPLVLNQAMHPGELGADCVVIQSGTPPGKSGKCVLICRRSVTASEQDFGFDPNAETPC